MTAAFAQIFDALRPVYAAHASACVVLHDDADRYYLGTHEVRARDGYRTDFGGVLIKRAYVSAHLMPVYVYPDLLAGLSPDLKRRMQGKSCFNFKTPDPDLFAEFAGLVDAGAARFKAEGKI